MTPAVLVTIAVLLAVPGSAGRRLRRVLGSQRAVNLDLGLTAAALVPLLALLVFGPVGLVVGLASAPIVRRQVAALESLRDRRRSAELVRQLPLALDLVAAVLAVGRSPQDAMRIVAASTPPPLGDELSTVAHRVRLAADSTTAWRTLDGGVLEPVGRALARSEATGAAIVPLMRDVAQDLRRRVRAEQRELVGRIAVRTTAPLGLCLLPAFVLIGVAPTVIAIVGTISL